MKIFKRIKKNPTSELCTKDTISVAVDQTPAEIFSHPLKIEEDETLSPKKMKDTFVSAEMHLSGNLEGQGNIIIEGILDGYIISTHQVRIEYGGTFSGNIHAQNLVVNGKVDGRLYADSITLRSNGFITGDIFTDELIIEKGGVLVGQSQLKNNITPDELKQK